MVEIIKEKDKINSLYRNIWINTLKEFEEKQMGVHFWLQKADENNYVLFYFGENGLTESILNMNKLELEIIENKLKEDGFEFIKTENNRILLMIKKEYINNYLKNTKESMNKMPITPFAETRKR